MKLDIGDNISAPSIQGNKVTGNVTANKRTVSMEHLNEKLRYHQINQIERN